MPFDIGPGELILVLVVALIVFGPSKLPDMGRQIGKAVREFKRMSSAATEEMTRALELDPQAAQREHLASAPLSAGASDAAAAGTMEPTPYQPAAEPMRTAIPGMVFCSRCGTGTAETNNFCSICGSALRPPAPGEPSIAPTPTHAGIAPERSPGPPEAEPPQTERGQASATQSEHTLEQNVERALNKLPDETYGKPPVVAEPD